MFGERVVLLDSPKKLEKMVVFRDIPPEQWVKKHDELLVKIKTRDRDIKLLRSKVDSFAQSSQRTRKDLKFLLQKFSSLRDKQSLSVVNKNKSLSLLKSDVFSLKEQIVGFNKQINIFQKFISCFNGNFLLKKLPDLGTGFFVINKILDIQENDLLLVDDLSVVSQKTIDFLDGKVQFVFFRKPTKKSLPFSLLNAKGLSFVEIDFFDLLDKSVFESEKSKLDILSRVVSEYREKRLN